MLPYACNVTSCDVCVLQVKRMLHYQIPPRGFWFWWCDGFQVYDALVVALWLAINILYVEQRTSLVMSLYKGEQRTPLRSHAFICTAYLPASQATNVGAALGRGLPWAPPRQDAQHLSGIPGQVRSLGHTPQELPAP